jgi:glycosyltransferase involved in cell wall biosynthesis
MKIAWLCSDPVVEGSLGVTDKVAGARYFRARGHEVTVVCGAGPAARSFPDVPTHRIETRYRPFLAWWDQWPGVLSAFRGELAGVDVAICDFALLPPVMRFVGERRRAGFSAPGVVLDVRTPPVEAGRVRTAVQRARFGLTLRRYGRRVDAITAITEGMRDYTARFSRVPPGRILVFRSGSSWCEQELPPRQRPPELPEWLEERFVVFYHGSMTGGRGLFQAVEAVERVRSIAPDLTLVLLGGGAAVPALKALAARRGLRREILFLDPVDHDRVPQFILSADVGLAPWPAVWQWEIQSPLKLAEYLSLGLPSVMTAIRPHQIVPLDASFAFWAESAEPGHLAAALVQARENRDRLPQAGLDARRWAEEHLGWSTQLAVLEKVLLEVTGAPQAGRAVAARAARSS